MWIHHDVFIEFSHIDLGKQLFWLISYDCIQNGKIGKLRTEDVHVHEKKLF